MRRLAVAFLLVALVAAPLVQATQGQGEIVVRSSGDLHGRATMTADRTVLSHQSRENGSLSLDGDLTVVVRSTTYYPNGSRRTDNETHRYPDGSARSVRGAAMTARLDGPVRVDDDPPADYQADGTPSLVVSPGVAFAEVRTGSPTTGTGTTSDDQTRQGSDQVQRHAVGNLSIAPISPIAHDGGIDLAVTSGAIVVDGDLYRTAIEQRDRTVCDERIGDQCIVDHQEQVTVFNQTFVRADQATLDVDGMTPSFIEDPENAGGSTELQGSATLLAADAWSLQANATIRFGQAQGTFQVGDETFPVEDTFVEVGGELDVELAADAAAFRDRTGEQAPSEEGRTGYPATVQGDIRYLRVGRTAETFPADPVTVGAAGLGVALLAAAAYLWPALKFAATKLVVAPFYAQVEGEEVLDNETRSTIFEAIQSDPGLSATDLSKRADCGWGTVVYHLAVLEQNGMIISSRDGRHRRFFPYSGMDFRHKDVFSAIRNETTAAILNAIRDSPGIHQKALRKEVDLAASTVNWHISKLEDADLVEKERDGRKVRYHPGANLDLLSERDLDPS